MFTDYLGIAIDTEGMPKHLQQTLNSHICYKGGGGGGTTTTSTQIDPEIRKRITPALDAATEQYEYELNDPDESRARSVAGQEGVVGALEQQDQLSRSALEGTGIFDETDAVNRQLQNLQGQQLAQQQGSLNSARADKARQSVLADKALEFQDRRQQQAAQGAQALTGTQQAKRGLEQERLDAPHQALSRYFGYLGSAPQSQQQTSNQGGGGK